MQENKTLNQFSNNLGEVKLMLFNNQYAVTSTPKFGDPSVEYFNNLRNAQIAYSYIQHYFTLS